MLKTPHHSQHTPTAAQIQRFFKTRGYLPLTRYQWARTNSLKFICQWKFTSAQKVKCAWQLFSLLSWFVRLAVKGWIVCVFSVSLCLLQSRGEHHLFLHLTGTSFSPPLLQPNPCRKKKKLNLLLFDSKVSLRHPILSTLEREMLNLNLIGNSEELGQLLQPQSHCHRVQCSTKRRIILSNCWLHRCLYKWCRVYNILN